jgi:uncharacterized protein (TIGR02145 family)
MKPKTIVTMILIILSYLSIVAQTSGNNADMFTDPRDGQTYRTVKIGDQTWMAENLNYQTKDSWCYHDSASYCAKYGRLYTWDAAKMACPVGWRLPTDEDWIGLINIGGGWGTASKKLKSKTGWVSSKDGKPMDNGTDELGFSALPGGSRHIDGHFRAVGSCGEWWSAEDTKYVNYSAHNLFMSWHSDRVLDFYHDKSYGYSLRCVEDVRP